MNISFNKEYDQETCITCGIVSFIPTIYLTQLKRSKELFFCPNGHTQSYTRSSEDTLKEKLASKEKALEMTERDLHNARRIIEKLEKDGKPRKRTKAKSKRSVGSPA